MTLLKVKKLVVGLITNGGTFLVMLLLVLVAGVLTYRIPLAEYIGHQLLADAGLPKASFKISRFDATSLQASNLVLGPELSSRRVTATYQIANLIKGKLGEITIEGAQVDLSNPDQGIFEVLTNTEKSSGSELPLFSIPSIKIIDAKISGSYQGTQFRLIADGNISPNLAINIKARGAIDNLEHHVAFDGITAELSPFQDREIKKSFPVTVTLEQASILSGEHNLALKGINSIININSDNEPSASIESAIKSLNYIQGEMNAEIGTIKVTAKNLSLGQERTIDFQVAAEKASVRSGAHDLTLQGMQSNMTLEKGDAISVSAISTVNSVAYVQETIVVQANLLKIIAPTITFDENTDKTFLMTVDSSSVRSGEHDLYLKGLQSAITIDTRDVPSASVKTAIKTARYAQKKLIVQANSVEVATTKLTSNVETLKSFHIAVESSSVVSGEEKITSQGIKADVIAYINTEIAEVNFTLDHISEDRLPPLSVSGFASLSPQEAEFNADILINDLGPAAQVSGRYGLEMGIGEASVSVGPITFSNNGLQPRDYLKELDFLKNVQGAIGANALIEWRQTPAKLNARGQVQFDKFSVSNEFVRVKGLSGTIGVDQLFPLEISEYQTLTADRIITAVPINNPSIKFRAVQEGDEFTLDIDHAEAGIAEGILSADQTILKTLAPENQVNLKVENLDLEKLLEMAAIEGVSANGKINGLIPFRVGREQLLIDQGILKTDGGGILKIRSEQVRAALSGGGEQVGLLLDVLEDFHYQDLSLSLEKNEWSEAVVRMKTNGYNPAVKNGHPFRLNINVTTNLEKILAIVFQAWHLSEDVLRSTFGHIKGLEDSTE